MSSNKLTLPKICSCVVLYNPKDNVYDRIQLYYHNIERIYIVDNTEKDHFNEQLYNELKKLGKVHYTANFENYGIARALNQAINKARKDEYEFILTMDQDSSVQENYIEKIFGVLQKNKLDYATLGIISPFHKTHSECINNDTQEITDKLMVMTSGNLLNIEAHKKTGGFWEDLFIDWVDIEYCLRLKKNNYRVIQINTVILSHPLGETSKHAVLNKTFYSLNHSALRRYYQTRNAFFVLDRYKKLFPELVLFKREFFLYTLKSVIFFEKDKINKLKMMLKGYRDYKNNVFGKFLD